MSLTLKQAMKAPRKSARTDFPKLDDLKKKIPPKGLLDPSLRKDLQPKNKSFRIKI